MGFCDSLGIIFSFHLWQATQERKNQCLPLSLKVSRHCFRIFMVFLVFYHSILGIPSFFCGLQNDANYGTLFYEDERENKKEFLPFF